MQNKAVKNWLLLGLILIFFQIILGGITRLTGSGLSITKWDIVTGAIPPLNESSWQQEFDLYKLTPQYQKINQGMSLSQFKWIFFWEYIHRLWARSMGFVFLFPFIFFWVKGYLHKELKKKLIVVFVLAGLVGAFGWIMVASGLVNRPWVNAYKLSIHLGLALVTLSYLYWVYLEYNSTQKQSHIKAGVSIARWFLILVSIQIILGGMMAGMKAALVYPTFPKMGSYWIDPVILDWKWSHFIDYDKSRFLSAWVQLLHRITGFLLCTIFFLYNYKKVKTGVYLLIGMGITIQICFGIVTLVLSKGYIPVFWGVLHQSLGIFILLLAVKWYFLEKIYINN